MNLKRYKSEPEIAKHLFVNLTMFGFLLAATNLLAVQAADRALAATPQKSEQETETQQTSLPQNNDAESINRDCSVLTPPATFQGKKTTSVFADKNPRLILVLGGGAGKAVAQIGVIRSLEKHKIPIDAIVGTSMGATIGALYCNDVPLDQIEKMFLDKSLHHSIMSGVIKGTILHPIMKLAYLVTGRPYAGASSGASYLQFLRRHLPQTFSQLKIPFAAVATNITDGKTCVFSSGDLPQAVLASSSVPLMFRPVTINGKLYLDGGLRANLPADIAQRMGDGVVVSVLCDNAIKPVPNKTFKSKSALVLRVTDIMIAAADKPQAKDSDVLIYPNVDFVPAVPKNVDVLQKAISVGEHAADLVMPKIVEKLAAFDKMNQKQIAKKTASGKARM